MANTREHTRNSRGPPRRHCSQTDLAIALVIISAPVLSALPAPAVASVTSTVAVTVVVVAPAAAMIVAIGAHFTPLTAVA